MRKVVYVSSLILFIAVSFFFIKEMLTRKSGLLSSGRLIYTNTVNFILTAYSMGLSSREIKKLHTEKDNFWSYINQLDSDWVLLGKYNVMRYRIFKFNTKTGEMVFLRKGRDPVYMPLYNKMVNIC